VPDEEIRYWYDEKLNYNFDSSPFGQLVEAFIRQVRGDQPGDLAQLISEQAAAPLLRDPQTFRQFQEFLLNTVFWEANTADHFDDYDPEAVPEFMRPDWLTSDVVLQLQKHFDLLGYIPEEVWQGNRVNVAIALFTPALKEAGILTQPPEQYDRLDLLEKEETRYRKDDHGSYFDRTQKAWVDMSPVGVAMRDIEDLIKAHPWGAPVADWQSIIERENLQMIDEHQALGTRLMNHICQESGYWREVRHPDNLPWLTKDVMPYLDDTFGWGHGFGRHMHERHQYDWLHQIISRYRSLPDRHQGFQQQTRIATGPDEPGAAYLMVQWLLKPWRLFLAYVVLRLIYTMSGTY